jgi:hypothetical protein
MATLGRPLAAFAFTGQNLGESELSRNELKTWRESYPARFAQSFAETVLHRIRKALAGAYLSRRLSIGLFTPDSPHQRRQQGVRVGFHWPKS